MSGISPLDIMKKAKASYECEICGDQINVWADSTKDISPQISDAWTIHLVEDHIDDIEIEFDSGIGLADALFRNVEEKIESGRVQRVDGEFVITREDEQDIDPTTVKE